MEVLKSIFLDYWKNIAIAILLIIILNTCTNANKAQLANELQIKQSAKRINALNDKLTLLEQSKQREKTKIVTVVKEVEKKITAVGSLNTKGIATYYQQRYKLPITITQCGVSLNDTIAKKNIVELIQKDGLVKELDLTRSMLNIEEQKGTFKDSIIVEKDKIQDNLNKSLRKERVKKNVWKLSTITILAGSVYLLVK